MTSPPLSLVLPEIIVAATGAVVYAAGAFWPARTVWRWVALAALIAAGSALWSLPPAGLGGSLVRADSLALYVRSLALLAGLLLVLLWWRPLGCPDTAESLGSLLLAIVGLMLVACAGDLALILLGLELISIPTYILLFLGPRSTASHEATTKYFFLSILASAILLYGLSFLYGTGGSTDLADLEALFRRTAAQEPSSVLVPFAKCALVLVFVGLGFKVAAVPFHFYAPDVYQGTTHANAALLSVVPKIAGMIALVRLVSLVVPVVEAYPWRIAMALAVVSMTLGNVVALWQDNVRRLMAYSSIAHAGYLLAGLSAYLATEANYSGPWESLGAILVYLLVYVVATLGVFAALACLGREDGQLDTVDELAGLAWTQGPGRKLLAWMLAVCLFSLAGVPPLAGFWGKWAVFFSTLNFRAVTASAHPWMIALATIGVLNAAIGAAYYLRVVGAMFFRAPATVPRVKRGLGGPWAAAVLCAVLTVLIGVLPGPWIRAATQAAARQPPASVAMSGQQVAIEPHAPLPSGNAR